MLPAAVYGEQLKLYLDNSRTHHIMVEKQDCSVHQTLDGYVTFGISGFSFFGIGPGISIGKKSGIDWDHTTQNLVARYQELCAQFNTGRLSKPEYDKRLAEIEATELAITRDKKKHRQIMFDELNKETNFIESLKSSYDRIK